MFATYTRPEVGSCWKKIPTPAISGPLLMRRPSVDPRDERGKLLALVRPSPSKLLALVLLSQLLRICSPILGRFRH
jgi:hypothetical protein